MVNTLIQSGLWGQQFQDPETAEAFRATAMLQHMLAFERAWTEALVAVDGISESIADEARTATSADRLDLGVLGDEAERNGLPIPGFVKQLRAGLSEAAAKAIHTGSTSQDVIDTSIVLASLGVLDQFETRQTDMLKALDTLSSQFGDRQMMGRTRMQAALPITVGQRIATWRDPLAGHLAALADLRTHLGAVQVGGPVGTRDARMEALAARVAAELKISNTPCWHGDRTRFVDLGHWLTKVSGTLGKMGQDLALMAQQGVDEVKIDGAGGSSAMPHKANPVRAETLIALSRFVAGQQAVLAGAMVHEQERSGAAWSVEWLTLPQMSEATGAALNTGLALLGQIKSLGAED